MDKIGVSCCGAQELTREVFDAYAAAGIDCMELSFSRERYNGLNYKKIAGLARDCGVSLWSFHMPFYPFDEIDISSRDGTVRKNSIELLRGFMEKTSDIGIRTVVIHPSGEPIDDNEREDRLGYAADSLCALAELAHSAGQVIAVEDLPRTCLGRDSAEIKRLLQASGRLSVCFDTNHLLKEPIKDFIDKVGDKIVTIHASDYDFIDERHWLPGEGKIDWPELLNALESAKYRGPFMYELGLCSTKTIERQKKLTYDDFAENFRALKNRQKPKQMGRILI